MRATATRSLQRAGEHFLETRRAVAGPSRLCPIIIAPSACRRSISTSVIRNEQPAWRRPNPRAPPPEVNVLTLSNYAIPFPEAHLVQPDNKLSPLIPLRQILSSLSTETHKLIVVSKSPPVVKLLDLAEEAKKQRIAEAKARIQRKVGFEDKELQVSWASAPSDLQHKLSSAKHILEKGDRVQLVFASRKGSGAKSVEGGKITDAKKKDIVAMFEEGLTELGSKWREDNLEKGLWICFWAPKREIRDAVKVKVLDKEVTKRQERDEKRDARRRKQEERLLRSREAGMNVNDS